LRERAGDIVLLAEHFATRMTAALGREYFPGFAPAALEALAAHAWPGNVRELRNAVERSVARLADPTTPLTTLVIDPFGPPSPPAAASSPSAPPRPRSLAAAERALEAQMLAEALAATRFNQRAAAARLGLGYDQFRRRLRTHPELRRTDTSPQND
jgi:psp operon transcriptional activator